MAQNYVVMARKNLLKPSEAPKYYAVAKLPLRKSASVLRNVPRTPKESWKAVSVSFCSKSSMYWMKGISFRWAIWGISA